MAWISSYCSQVRKLDTFPKVPKPCLQIASFYYRCRKSNLTSVKMSRWILGDLLFLPSRWTQPWSPGFPAAGGDFEKKRSRNSRVKTVKIEKWKNCLRRLPGQVCFVGINWGLHATPLSAHVAQTLARNLKFPGSLFADFWELLSVSGPTYMYFESFLA